MEENTSIVTSLNLIDFDEWINIPKPLVQALMVFKQCFVEQTRKSEDYSKEFENLTNKVNLRLKMLNDIQANTNEAIRKQQDTILKKVKERCDVLANDLSLFKNNFSEENAAEKKNISEILREMREKLGKFGKVISGTLTAGEINQIVNEKCLNIQISITNEIREQHIRPVTEKIANEVKLNSEKQSKTNQILNSLVSTLDSKTQTEIVKVLSGFEDFKNLSQSQIKDAEDQIKKALDELGILTKQFEVLKKKFVQNEGKHSVDQASVSKEIKELSENFSGISKKIENFKQAASPILRKRSSMLGPKISINEDFTFSQAVESDYISPKYSELESEIKAHISRSTSEMQALKSELTSFFQKKIQPLEEKLQDSHKDYEKITGELQQKLSWLPINLSELNGMGPNDARLFTIEARLRAEENSRISALKTIEKSLEVISRKSPLHCKTPERRNAPNRGNSVDLLHRKTEYVEKRVESVDRRYKHTGGAEEGIYDSFEYRGKGNLRGHKSIDLNKELLLLGKVGNRKLFKK